MGFNYIVIDNGRQLLPIIYPDVLVHDEVAAVIRVLPNFKAGSKVVSAGSIDIDVISCSGESSTLNLKSSPGDEELIDSFPYMHGLK
jgi:hypothetical protein